MFVRIDLGRVFVNGDGHAGCIKTGGFNSGVGGTVWATHARAGRGSSVDRRGKRRIVFPWCANQGMISKAKTSLNFQNVHQHSISFVFWFGNM